MISATLASASRFAGRSNVPIALYPRNRRSMLRGLRFTAWGSPPFTATSSPYGKMAGFRLSIFQAPLQYMSVPVKHITITSIAISAAAFTS